MGLFMNGNKIDEQYGNIVINNAPAYKVNYNGIDIWDSKVISEHTNVYNRYNVLAIKYLVVNNTKYIVVVSGYGQKMLQVFNENMEELRNYSPLGNSYQGLFVDSSSMSGTQNVALVFDNVCYVYNIISGDVSYYNSPSYGSFSPTCVKMLNRLFFRINPTNGNKSGIYVILPDVNNATGYLGSTSDDYFGQVLSHFSTARTFDINQLYMSTAGSNYISTYKLNISGSSIAFSLVYNSVLTTIGRIAGGTNLVTAVTDWSNMILLVKEGNVSKVFYPGFYGASRSFTIPTVASVDAYTYIVTAIATSYNYIDLFYIRTISGSVDKEVVHLRWGLLEDPTLYSNTYLGSLNPSYGLIYYSPLYYSVATDNYSKLVIYNQYYDKILEYQF